MDVLKRIRVLREGGNTLRSHVIPHLDQYTVGKHSYDALSILLVLHPGPSTVLIECMLWHDVAERWVGDLPGPVKWFWPGVHEPLAEAEEEVLRFVGVPVDDLNEEDLRWLKACDLLEFFLWCQDQLAIGNLHAENAKEAVAKQLEIAGLPTPARQYWERLKNHGWRRGPELIDLMKEVQGE